VFLQIGAADPAPHIGGQVGYDVVDRLGHGREGVVGAEQHMIAAEHINGVLERPTVVSQ
jgi:hypothetical protein